MCSRLSKSGRDERCVYQGASDARTALQLTVRVGEGRIETQPGKFSMAGEGLCVGRDAGDAVTDDYPGSLPWEFTGGTTHRVAVDVSADPYIDLEREAVAMMSRE